MTPKDIQQIVIQAAVMLAVVLALVAWIQVTDMPVITTLGGY